MFSMENAMHSIPVKFESLRYICIARKDFWNIFCNLAVILLGPIALKPLY